MFVLIHTKKPHLCKVKFCKNKRHQKRVICAKHVMQEWRTKNPVLNSFRNIKDRAKKRGTEFTITKEEFVEFCKNSGYPAKGLHLDRIEATEGYHIWNIQVLGGSENIAKGNRERHSPRYQEYLRKKREKELQENGITEEDCPF